MDTQLTLGLAALRIGVQYQHLFKLARKKLIPHTRAGRIHLVKESDLPTILAACRAAGYLHVEAVAHA